jgi:hypothetical protein
MMTGRAFEVGGVKYAQAPEYFIKRIGSSKLYRKFIRAKVGLSSPWEDLHGQVLF